MPKPANVLILSGHDPSGGAGFQADLETVGALGCHGAGMLTALTQQDTHNAYDVWPTASDRFTVAMGTLFADMAFAAVKIGVLGNPEQAELIAQRLARQPDLPVVLDPVLRAGGGATLAADPVARALRNSLFSHTTLLTPNAAEARMLCGGTEDLQACGETLSSQVQWVLITGGDEAGEHSSNYLFHDGALIEQYDWPHLNGAFHGSGCTLSAAIAACLACGDELRDAIATAQHYTHEALANAFAPGGGQLVPARVHRSP